MAVPPVGDCNCCPGSQSPSHFLTHHFGFSFGLIYGFSFGTIYGFGVGVGARAPESGLRLSFAARAERVAAS